MAALLGLGTRDRPRSSTTGDGALVDALAQLSFLVQGVLTQIVGEYDLSVVQTRLLGVLRDRRPTMNQLGRHLGGCHGWRPGS
ncbi:hypothetical protein [Streptomyces sp. NPDC005374]|uniref:hypothetical protein n=1 Tax=Streptomyces sp. NPDC005374 TaxID=3364713 RepID=UPI003699A67D